LQLTAHLGAALGQCGLGAKPKRQALLMGFDENHGDRAKTLFRQMLERADRCI